MITDELREKAARALCLSRAMPACECTKETGCQAPSHNLVGEFGIQGRHADAVLAAVFPLIRDAVLDEAADAARKRTEWYQREYDALLRTGRGVAAATEVSLMAEEANGVFYDILALKTEAGNE